MDEPPKKGFTAGAQRVGLGRKCGGPGPAPTCHGLSCGAGDGAGLALGDMDTISQKGVAKKNGNLQFLANCYHDLLSIGIVLVGNEEN